jgi:hypothetical protein
MGSEQTQHASHDTSKAPSSGPAREVNVERGPRSSSTVTSLDTTHAIELVLRAMQERAIRAVRMAASPARDAHVAAAADAIAIYAQEAARLATIQRADWSRLRVPLANMLLEVHELRLELLSDQSASLKEHLDGALAHLHHMVPEKLWESAAAVTRGVALGVMGEKQHLELARQAIAALTTEVGRFRALKPGSDRAQAIEICAPLPTHCAVAIDAAMAITDRRRRFTLTPDVERASSELDFLASFLVMAPRLTWDRSFAAVFDAENRLRQAIGATPRVRPYSGKVDPKEALDQIEHAANGSREPDGARLRFTDPTSAVAGISTGMTRVLKRQIAAVETARGLLSEPAVRRSSWLDALLLTAVNLALVGAAGVIGNLAHDSLKNAAMRFARPRRMGLGNFAALSPKIQKEVLDAGMEAGWLAELAAAEGAKDATKQLVKNVLKVSGTAPHRVPGGKLLDDFVAGQNHQLDYAGDQKALMVAQLSPALAQADLGLLDALADALHGDIANLAYDAQLAATMREWHNMRARMDGGVRSEDENGDGKERAGVGAQRAAIDERAVAGTLDVVVAVEGDLANQRTLQPRMRLQDAGPGAVRYYREKPVSLARSGLNKRIELRFHAPGNIAKVSFGVGPDHRLLPESLGAEELAVLMVYGSGLVTTFTNVLQARRGELDIPVMVGVDAAEGLLAQLSRFTTTGLEEA